MSGGLTTNRLGRGVKYKPEGHDIETVVLYETHHFVDPTESQFIEAYKRDEWAFELLASEDIVVERIISKDALNEVPWRTEADALSKYSVLGEQQAEVLTLKWRDYSRQEIAEELSEMPSSIESTRQFAIQKLNEAASTPIHGPQ